jgi:hypothetical protein
VGSEWRFNQESVESWVKDLEVSGERTLSGVASRAK